MQITASNVLRTQYSVFSHPQKGSSIFLHTYTATVIPSVHIRKRICMIIFILHSRLFFLLVVDGARGKFRGSVAAVIGRAMPMPWKRQLDALTFQVSWWNDCSLIIMIVYLYQETAVSKQSEKSSYFFSCTRFYILFFSLFNLTVL